MSLRLRLNLLLTAIFLVTIAIGGGYVIADARRSVNEELRSSIELTSTLIALVVAHVNEKPMNSAARLMEEVARLGHTRHLHIEIVGVDAPPPAGRPWSAHGRAEAPSWFVRLIEPGPRELVRSVSIPGGRTRVIVHADATDEITEAWREARIALAVMSGFCLLANGLIFVVVGAALVPLRETSVALERIEHGDYDARLQRVGLPDIDVITDRFNEMADVLARSHAEMGALAQRSLAIQEEERRYLAHELHDEMGQSISAIKALAVSIGQRADGVDESIKGSASTIAAVSGDVYDRVRQMMSRLRPVILDELGLVSALETMIDAWNAHHEEVFCRFETHGELPKLTSEIGINLFRIVQEALTNIAKHARATEAAVTLRFAAAAEDTGSGELTLLIADNGIGFAAETTPRGLGLVGIFERARAMNGRLALATRPDAGTQFVLHVTLQAERST